MDNYYINWKIEQAHKKLIKILDTAFTPDVRIKVSGDNSIITACEAVLSALDSHQAYDKDMRPELRNAIAKAYGIF